MSAAAAVASRRLERLAAPLVPSTVAVKVGDIVRLAQPGGDWFYCRVEDRIAQGDLVCSVVDAQCWPMLVIEGIRPGENYLVAPASVLSIVRSGSPLPAG